MSRKTRTPSPTGIYHWIQRGIHKKRLFHRHIDFVKFKGLLYNHMQDLGISLYHYCLMDNHIHLLLKVDQVQLLSKFSNLLTRRYTYYYCGKYKWVGGLFTPRYRSFNIENESYLLECGRYIERNPVRAKLVEKSEDWLYSSYRHYAKGKNIPFISPNVVYLALSEDEGERRKLYRDHARHWCDATIFRNYSSIVLARKANRSDQTSIRRDT